MRGLEYHEATAREEGNAEYLKEVRDDGPSMAQALFAIAKVCCERLGPDTCPFRDGVTREGFCVANWSPCIRDKRNPTVAAYVNAAKTEQTLVNPKVDAE